MSEAIRDPAPPKRRRSSLAYDPARDTFKALPDALPEDAIAEDPEEEHKAEAAVTASPVSAKGTKEQPRKRRLSESMDGEVNNGFPEKNSTGSGTSRPDSEQTMSEQPRKRRRSESLDGEAKDSGTRKDELLEDSRASTSGTLKQATNAGQGEKTKPRTPADLPRIPRKPREDEPRTSRYASDAYSRRPDAGERRRQDRSDAPSHRRSRSPPSRRSAAEIYRRRSPPRERRRSPSPIRVSPPPQVIRPGGARGRGRNVLAEQQRLAAEREQKQAALLAQTNRGVQEVSNQWYNQRPEWVKEKGRDWRKNESQIKGLRSFNNWIKSCLIHKFSPEEKEEEEEAGWGEEAKEPAEQKPLLVLDIGCGKGGDLGKWQLAPQQVGLYVGLDPAETSIQQARDRYGQMRRGRRPIFDGRFFAQDCFGAWIGDVGIVREVGIDPNADNGQPSRWGGGGFDIVACMFAMHYSFESEEKVRIMLRNVAGSLKKGGRFIGVVPNSDVCTENIQKWFKNKAATKSEANGGVGGASEEKEDGEADEEGPSWGNSIYKVRFPIDPMRPLQPDGSFRPPFSWKYTYWMAEAVDVPEFVVPWEAFRAIAEQYNLEQRYRKPFLDIWNQEQGNREMMQLAVRMGVVRYEGGDIQLTQEEREAVAFYHAFCFVKV
ncbi:mRNA (guanine-N7-)-methyltransferase [Cladophialophora yegresii CBS 114405]|uniref:mRNA cap guanine-N(7) methyltransferase n=1 Tax=Cladophialophora yegresii CBS 114405 TaxID=1182544 RepID=W9VEK0_9EURO|nr:mRNA (guanine-N7-)-methyltransferase [Cladophialophora yegresii CBS 114405]EXJ53888.1 mRNA (guanine-N7-)-methyltransferase [Cladophialophora yegresii CBS 114405]